MLMQPEDECFVMASTNLNDGNGVRVEAKHVAIAHTGRRKLKKKWMCKTFFFQSV